MMADLRPASECWSDDSVFAGYDQPRLARLGVHGRYYRFGKGEKIFFAGQARECVWLVVSGWVRILMPRRDGESTVEILSPGDIFGCPACSAKVYTCTAAALSEVQAVSYPARKVEAFLKSDPEALCRLSRTLARRVQEVAFLKGAAAERSAHRIPAVLSWLSQKFGAQLPVDRALLADVCGLRRETCSRLLAALKRRGVVRLDSGRITIVRPEALQRRTR